jgi:hypothetical protein
MGKRSAVGELFLGNMGSIQWETRPSIQREDQLTMETKLEQIAANLQCCETPAEERSAGNPHATFCGNWRRATASSDPVGGVARRPPIPINQCCVLDDGLESMFHARTLKIVLQHNRHKASMPLALGLVQKLGSSCRGPRPRDPSARSQHTRPCHQILSHLALVLYVPNPHIQIDVQVIACPCCNKTATYRIRR